MKLLEVLEYEQRWREEELERWSREFDRYVKEVELEFEAAGEVENEFGVVCP